MSPPSIAPAYVGDASPLACTPIISVATAPYDGYEIDRMFESLARIGVTHVALSDPAGYRQRLDEARYSPECARTFAAALERHGLKCHAVSAHLNLLAAPERKEFARRLDFASRVGARVVNTFAGARERELDAVDALRRAADLASERGLKLGLENAADGRESLLNVAGDAPRLLDRIGSTAVGLTYDVGNALAHRPQMDVVADAMAALPYCVQVHLKDVSRLPEGWIPVALGTGLLNLKELVCGATRGGIPMSIELPLRQSQLPDGVRGRSRYRVALRDIETAVATSLHWLKHCASASRFAELTPI